MSRYIITPWRTHSDLLQIRDQLFHPSPDQETPTKRHAISRIHTWKLRGNLPHAIESTALLLDAQLHHHSTLQPQPQTKNQSAPHASSSLSSDFSIRAVYTAAFTRFVTGFCDIGRHKERSLEPSSMLKIALQIGMPEEFVALRHEATHEELPGLRRLVVATERALEWLWGVYWVGLDSGGREEVEEEDVGEVREEARRLLKAWRSLRVAMFKKKSARAKDGRAEEQEKILHDCIGLCNGRKRRVEAFVGVLVDERLILPSNPVTVPINGAFLVWDGLIFDLIERLPGFDGTLSQALLAGTIGSPLARDVDDAVRGAFSWWISHMTEVASYEKSYQLKARAMRYCCLYPSSVTQELGQRLLEDSDAEFRQVWEDIFTASKLRDTESTEEMPEDRHDAGPGSEEAESVDRMQLDAGPGGWSRAAIPPNVPIGVVS